MKTKLPTRCFFIRFDCCGRVVGLAQRGHDLGARHDRRLSASGDDEPLTWTGVPCDCGRTYTFERAALHNDALDMEIERLHPKLERMHCWLIPNEPPDPKYIFDIPVKRELQEEHAQSGPRGELP